MHAVIECREDGAHIVDLGSGAGTLVNGERVVACRGIWMSDGLIVLDTARRVLPIAPASVGNQDFVRLRRALIRMSVTG